MDDSLVTSFMQLLASLPDEDRQLFEAFVRHIQKLLIADRKLLMEAHDLLALRVAELESHHDATAG